MATYEAPVEERILGANEELQSAISYLENIAEADVSDPDTDWGDLDFAIKRLSDAQEEAYGVGDKVVLDAVDKASDEVRSLIQETRDEFRAWSHEESRHHSELMSIASKAKQVVEKLKRLQF